MAARESGFQEQEPLESGSARMVWRLQRPDPAPVAGAKSPIVLFLHGAGLEGSDNQAQLRDARRFSTRAPEPAFLIAPQCPEGLVWAAHDTKAGAARAVQPAEASSEALELALAALERILAEEASADAERVYLVGVGSGGAGAWDALVRWPGRFAASLAVGGGPDLEALAKAADGPEPLCAVWAAHGSGVDRGDDGGAGPQVQALDDRHETLRTAIEGVAGCSLLERCRLTTFPGATADCWDHVFDDVACANWLFSFARSRPESQPCRMMHLPLGFSTNALRLQERRTAVPKP